MIGATRKAIGNQLRYAALARRDRRAGRRLRLVQNRLDRLEPADIILVTCLRNERFRLPFFTDYYRRLGVGHFLIIDNDSDDDLMEWAATQPDVSVWWTDASYRAAQFGMLWCNDLLRRHGVGRWCVTVDPDEFLVYPHMETRPLSALTRFLDEEERPSMNAVLLDAYGPGRLSDAVLEEGADPFEVCPYFDRDGFVQSPGWGRGVFIRGGPRLRVHFTDNPAQSAALNKIPLIKWRRHYHYRMSTHDAWPWRLNQPHARGSVSVTGALFHFKLVATLRQKAEEEATRREHFADGREYRRYREREDPCFFSEGLSERYRDSAQLESLGLISPGRWF